jgi:hypothetical protein
MRLGDAHAGLAANAVETIAEGDVELGEHGRRGRGGLKKFTPPETSPHTSWRLSSRWKVVPVETSVA